MSLEGVMDVDVRYEDRSLGVTFDDEKITVGNIIKKIGDELGLMMEEGELSAKKEGAAETCPM